VIKGGEKEEKEKVIANIYAWNDEECGGGIVKLTWKDKRKRMFWRIVLSNVE
jgi:hypothetical protein